MTMATPRAEDAWRHDAIEPNTASLLGLARELVDRHRTVNTWWDGPGSRHVHHQTSRWALVHHGWWADDATVARLRAAIRHIENEQDQAA